MQSEMGIINHSNLVYYLYSSLNTGRIIADFDLLNRVQDVPLEQIKTLVLRCTTNILGQFTVLNIKDTIGMLLFTVELFVTFIE